MPTAPNFLQGGNTRLGRQWGNGIIRGVRPLTHMLTTGFREVESNAEFMAGMALQLNAEGLVVPWDNSLSSSVLGIALNSKTTAFYLPFEENVEWGAAGGDIVQLQHPNLQLLGGDPLTPEIRITNLGGDVDLGIDGLYTFDNTVTDVFGNPGSPATGNTTANGVFRVLDAADGRTPPPAFTAPPAGATLPTSGALVTVRYRYKDINTPGFDQTIGSGKVAILEGPGEVDLEVYDVSIGYAIGDPVAANVSGLFGTGAGFVSDPIGTVTRLPSVDNPHLGVKINNL